METVWKNHHADFLCRLHNRVVDQTINDISYLKFLQSNWERTIGLQKRCGYIFEQRGINLLDLIAKASCIPDVRHMDEEDEEKGGVRAREKVAPIGVKLTEHAVSLDPAREIGVRKGQIQGDVVQASDDRREEDVQARREVGLGPGRRRCPQEEAPRQKKKAAEGGGRGTVGLGNVEEGRLADGAKPKKKRVRKRPVLTGKGYANIN